MYSKSLEYFADEFEKSANDFNNFARQYQQAASDAGHALAPAFSAIDMPAGEITQALKFIAPTGMGLGVGKLLTMPVSNGLYALGRRMGKKGVPLHLLGKAVSGAGMVGGGLTGYHLSQTNIRDFIGDVGAGRVPVDDIPVVGGFTRGHGGSA